MKNGVTGALIKIGSPLAWDSLSAEDSREFSLESRDTMAFVEHSDQ